MSTHTGAAFGIDSNGTPTERVTIDGQTVVIHHDEIPESDITTIHGLRVTTAVRTIIDIAVDLERDELTTVMDDALGRGLFTVAEMRSRLSKPDMTGRRGAALISAWLDRRG